jgi:hypothetical protein
MRVTIGFDGSLDIAGDEVHSFERARSGQTTLLRFGHPYFLDTTEPVFWASAEALLELWFDQGPALVDRIDGSFTLVVVDAAERRLDLFTDRFGTNHLFSAWTDDALMIADSLAELVPLLQRVAPSPPAIQSFLMYGMILEDRSLIEGVSKLPPASHCRLDLGAGSKEFAIDRYWHAVAGDERMSAQDAVESIVTTFTETLRRSAAGASLSVPLTSGKDSRSILSVLIGQPGLHCYTHGDPSDPDATIAADIARRAGVSHDTYALDDGWIDAILDNAVTHATAFNGSVDHLRFLHVLNSYAREENRGGNFYPGAWANEVWEGKFLRPEFMSRTGSREAARAALGIIEDARGADYSLLAEDRDAVREPFIDHLEGVIRIDPDWQEDLTSTSIRLVQHSYSPHFFSAFSSYLARRFSVFHSFIQRPIVEAMPAVPIEFQKRAGLQHEVILRNHPKLADHPLFSEGVHRYIPSSALNRLKDRVHTSGVPRRLNTALERMIGRGFYNRRYFVDYQSWLFERHRARVSALLDVTEMRCGDFVDREALHRLVTDFEAGGLVQVQALAHPLTRLLSLELFLRAVE